MEIEWRYQPLPEEASLQKLGDVLGTSPLITTLLLQRGVTSLSHAKSFFTPRLEELHDPFTMRDMPAAVTRLQRAIKAHEHIRIYGDYDVDGTTSVALLYSALKQLGAAHISYYIPARATEGYGLSAQGVDDAIASQVDLLICVDCGTRAHTLLTHAQAHGIDSIVCDHHEPGPLLPPTVAMLNPKHPACPYPFKGLSACGVVFKLIQAMQQTQPSSSLDLNAPLDLLALSIAADIVPMTGENRILAHHGLIRIIEAPRPGIAALKQWIREKETPLTISDIVFCLAPRINAVGRMTHATPAVKLFLASDDTEASSWAKKLDQQNTSRKELDKATTAEALTMVATQPPRATIVAHKKGWPKGILGIVAARCVEHYHRPTVVLTEEDGKLTGSGRSIPGYNLYEAIHACAPLLTRYGGHAQAVGLTLSTDNLTAFINQFEEEVSRTLLPAHKTPYQPIDLSIRLAELSPATCRLLARMAPFGPQHRQPVFTTSPVTLLSYQIYQGKHAKIYFQETPNGPVWDAIGFNMAEKLLRIHAQTQTLAIAYKASIDRFRGSDRIQLTLKDLKGL